MAPRLLTAFFGLVLALPVLLNACHKDEPEQPVPQANAGSMQADTIRSKPIRPDSVRRYIPIQDAPPKTDTTSPQAHLADIPAPGPAANDTIAQPAPDSSLRLSFALREQMLNFNRPIAENIERVPVHPDSMTWEDIAGPLAMGETPDWITILSYIGKAAGLAAVLYVLFFND